jgi:hypothetical protein
MALEDVNKVYSLCQRGGGWLRRANGGGRAPGTGAALRPVLAGIRAMDGTLSAKRCVKLAPCSAAEARHVRGWTMAGARPLGRRLDEHRGETPPAYRLFAHRCSP